MSAGPTQTRPRHLAVYLPGLQGGGVERMSLNLLPELQRLGFTTTLVLTKAGGELLGQLPPGVDVVDLDAARTSLAVPKLAAYLRGRRPDVLISSLGHNNLAALVARRLSAAPVKVIVRQHNFLSSEARLMADPRYRALPMLYRGLLPWADGVVAVSEGVADDLAGATGYERGLIDVVPNPIWTPDLDARAAEPVEHPWLAPGQPPAFVAVGRLVEQKDYPTLLRALAKVREVEPLRLVVLGEGPLRGELERLRGELDLDGAVDFAGFAANPLPAIGAAAALVMSSRYEGFGNVLAEALACGTAVVSTDCPAGPSEILDGGRYGALVPVGDADAMARAMLEAAAAPRDRERLRRGAERFRSVKVAQAYAGLIERAVLGRDAAGAEREAEAERGGGKLGAA